MKKFNALYKSIIKEEFDRDADWATVKPREKFDLNTRDGKNFLKVFKKYGFNIQLDIVAKTWVKGVYWSLMTPDLNIPICDFFTVDSEKMSSFEIAEYVVANYKKLDKAFKKHDVTNTDLQNDTDLADSVSKTLTDKNVKYDFGQFAFQDLSDPTKESNPGMGGAIKDLQDKYDRQGGNRSASA